MKLFLVALKGLEHSVMPQCARDAKACAELFSGMEVVAISDLGEDGWLEAGPYTERAYAFRQAHSDAFGMAFRGIPNLMRWFVIDEYIRVHAITEPIVSIDWDSLVFENLETHFRKLSVTDKDIGDTIDKEGTIPDNRTAPYWVGNLSAIRFYTALLEAHVKCKTPLFLSAKRNGDMCWWQRVREVGCYNTPIDLSMEIDGALFDHNATCEPEDYESDSSGKKLFWLEGKPHFKRRSDGGLVKAVAIHCFWMWKEKTSDILQKATSNYSGE